MLVSELIAILQERLAKHGDVEVRATWEGITREMLSAGIYLSKRGPLYIDAEGHEFKMYKKGFAVDPEEGEVNEPIFGFPVIEVDDPTEDVVFGTLAEYIVPVEEP